MDETLHELWKRDVSALFREKDLDPDELGSNGRAAIFELFKRSTGCRDGVIWETCSSIYAEWPDSYHEMIQLINDHYPLGYCLPDGKNKIIIPCTRKFINILASHMPVNEYHVDKIHIYGLVVGTGVPMLVCFESKDSDGNDNDETSFNTPVFRSLLPNRRSPP